MVAAAWPDYRSYSLEQRNELLAKLTPDEQTEALAILEAEDNEATWERCSQKVASFDAGPLLWLTQYTKTEDTHWMSKGTASTAPFPRKQYFAVLLKYRLERARIFIPETREMMTSWACSGYVAWECQWNPGIVYVMQSQKESKANELVNYVRILYRMQEPWMKERVKVP